MPLVSPLMHWLTFLTFCAVFTPVDAETKGCNASTSKFGDDRVAVEPSGIAGAGLGAFALRTFKQGGTVGRYKCNMHRSSGAIVDQPYSWGVNSSHGCDGEPIPLHNPMRYVNSIAARDTCASRNVKVRIAQQHQPGHSPITYVATRDIQIGEELLTDYGALYFKGSHKRFVAGQRHECGLSALHLACAKGDLESVRALVSNSTVSSWGGLYSNILDVVNQPAPVLKWTPLMEAAAAGHVSVVQWLHDQGAELDTVAASIAKGISALSLACQNHQVKVVESLISKGAKVDLVLQDGATPLFMASRTGHVEIVSALIKGGAAVNYAKSNGATSILMASQMGHAEVVQALLNGGAATHRVRSDGASPLFMASHLGHTEVVKVLIDGGAAINQARADGAAPLHVASQTGHVAVVRALIDGGARVNQVLKDGTTPLFLASRLGHIEVIRALIKGGAAINLAKKNGATPLYIAKRMGHTKIVQILTHGG